MGEVADQEERLFGHDEGLIDGIDLFILMLMPIEKVNDEGNFLSMFWGGMGRGEDICSE